jgi:transcriptional regulator with XRE-family HTH domain
LVCRIRYTVAVGYAAMLLRTARTRAGLSQAELARRAGVSRPVVNAYERGSREPGVNVLQRLIAAAGGHLDVSSRGDIDIDRNARILAQVLDLAEELPSRRRGQLTFPPLHRLAAG